MIILNLLISLIAFSIEGSTVKRFDGSDITYYFNKPNGKNKFPILLVLQGSECKSIYETVQGKKIELLHGFARLDIEKPGLNKNVKENCPEEYLKLNSLEQRMIDFMVVINHLKKIESQFNGDLVIVGGSEGAHLAPFIAKLYPQTKKLILLASGGGLTFHDDFLLVTKSNLALEGKNVKEIEEATKQIENTFVEIRNNPTWTKTFAGNTNTYKWWNSILDLKPIDILIDFDFPILLIHGDADRSSSVETSRITEKLFKLKNKSNLTYKEFAGLDHHWFDSKKVHHFNEMMKTIIDWHVDRPKKIKQED